MTSFYKRRRGILEHLESGTISLLDLAVHDYLNLKANLLIGNSSSLPPGVCITSAAAIHATCPSQISVRAIQRSLEHMQAIGWIKRWNARGQRGNYPVLVCRASVHDVSGNEYRVDGTKTSDWRNPVLVPVGDLSSLWEVPDAKLSGHREERVENREKPRRHSALEDGFDSFWKTYPRKVAKKAAARAWAKVPESERAQVMAAVERFKLTEQWQKDGGQFIPHPDTFLNGRRWEDELPGRSPQGPNGHVPNIPTARDVTPEH